MPDTFPFDAVVIIVTFLTFALWAYVVDQTAEQEEKGGRRKNKKH